MPESGTIPLGVILVAAGAAALLLSALLLKKPHPNHAFFLGLIESLGEERNGKPRKDS